MTQSSPSRLSLIESLESRTLLSAAHASSEARAAHPTPVPSSTTTFHISTTSAEVGQAIKVSIKVKASKHAGKPSGVVEFLDNGTPITFSGGPVEVPVLGSGKAKYVFQPGNIALATGTHSLAVEYVTENTLPDSTSAAVTVNITQPAITPTADGLGIATVKRGHGKAIKVGQTARVLYTGFLASDASIFDYATAPHGAGATPYFDFQLGDPTGAIQGFDEGTVGMKVGESRALFIPSALGYGTMGQGSIPPNADLVFLITLLKIK